MQNVFKMTLSKYSTLTLNNGIEMPIIGLGTWTLAGKDAYQAVLWAVEMGYRLIDTAYLYGNERMLGDAIKDCNVPREKLFIASKVWDTDHGYEKTLRAYEKSLKKLNLDYLDLYLIHWPATKLRGETWKALEKMYNDERVRAIGVCNYTIRHMKELLNEAEVLPVVNQVEFSPFLYQKELQELCMSNKIYMEAYASLTRGNKFDNSSLKNITEKYKKSTAQIMIRWGIQHQVIQIPKSSNKTHLKENIDIFDFKISKEDMQILDNLNEDYRVVMNPEMYD